MLIDGSVWFPTEIGLVLIDRETNTVDRLVRFTEDRFPAFGSAVGFGYAWIGADASNGRIARIAIRDLDD